MPVLAAALVRIEVRVAPDVRAVLRRALDHVHGQGDDRGEADDEYYDAHDAEKERRVGGGEHPPEGTPGGYRTVTNWTVRVVRPLRMTLRVIRYVPA